MTVTTVTCHGPECGRPAKAAGLCGAHHQQKIRGKTLTRVRRRSSTPVVDRVIDALWCIGHAATVTEIIERSGVHRDAVNRAMRDHADLFVEAGTVHVEGRFRPVPAYRLSDAGMARLNGETP